MRHEFYHHDDRLDVGQDHVTNLAAAQWREEREGCIT